MPPVFVARPRVAATALLASLLTPMAVVQAQQPPRAVSHQAVSLLGDTLRAFPLSTAAKARYEAQLAEARRAYERTPLNVDSIIWYARRLGYLGLLRESIEIYTRGITLYPEDPWLYRHRGHRYLSVRDVDGAVRDLQRAQQLVAGRPDEVEPDGQPNAQNTPIGTLHSNIGYHLALAHYLRGEYPQAITVAQAEFDAATNDDRRVSMAHWLYLSLRRAGRHDDAARLLAQLSGNLRVIENDAYLRLVRLYRGELPPDSVLTVTASGELSVQDASSAYGVAAWHAINGRAEQSRALLERIVAGGQWGAFGSIAAEADLARLRRR